MAGVKVPMLEKIDQAAPMGPDIIKADIPDLGKFVDQQSKAVEGFGEQLMKYNQQVEDAAADTEANKAVYEYDEEHRKLMYGDGETVGIKFQEGNPNDIYAKFDEHMVEKFNSLKDNENLSGQARKLVAKRLTDKYNQLELQKMTEYGYQQAKYEDGVTNANVDMEKRTLSDASSLMSTDEAAGEKMYEDTIGRLVNLRLTHGIKTNGVIRDDEGTTLYLPEGETNPMRVKVNPAIDLQLKKDLSDGVSSTIEDALATGNVALANRLKDKYGQYIDTGTKKKLHTEFVKATLEDTSYRVAGAGINSPAAKAMLDGIKDPVMRDKVRDKAMDLTTDRERKLEQRRTQLETTAYNRVMNATQEAVQSGQITTKSDLEEMPLYRNLERNIQDPRKRQALIDAVVQPKTSNSSALARVQNLKFGGTDENGKTLREYSAEEAAEAASGLKKEDRRSFMKRYDAVTSPETGDAEARKYKRSGDEFKKTALSMDILKEDDFNRVSGKQFDKMVGWQTQLEGLIDDLGPNPSTKDVNETVRGFAVSIKKGEVYKPAERKVFNGGGTFGGITKRTAPPKITIQERMKYMKMFYDENGKAADRNSDELDKYILKKQSK